MAQSSIEYYEQEIDKFINQYFKGNIRKSDLLIQRHNLFYKIQEMHKQESIAAQMDMFHHLNNLPFGMQYLDKRESAEQFAEQYYNETFGSNNERD